MNIEEGVQEVQQDEQQTHICAGDMTCKFLKKELKRKKEKGSRRLRAESDYNSADVVRRFAGNPMPSISIVRRWREAVERLQRLLVAISVTGRAHATCCVRHFWEQKALGKL